MEKSDGVPGKREKKITTKRENFTLLIIFNEEIQSRFSSQPVGIYQKSLPPPTALEPGIISLFSKCLFCSGKNTQNGKRALLFLSFPHK